MKSLIYLSTESIPFDEDELMELSVSSKKRNKERGITGFISYKKGVFIQFLQGPENSVSQLFSTIFQDRRHKVKNRMDLDFENALFPNRGMRYYGHEELGPTRFADILELLLSRLSTALSEGQIKKLVSGNIERIAIRSR